MDPLTSAAASGMRSRIESLDMLANNIANASAPGFKADREFYNLYMSPEAADSPDGTTPATLPVIERQWTDFAQGVLTPTSNSLDLALNGKGFFVANSSSGHIFTRNGSFRLSSQGELETSDGHAVLDTNGKPIVVDNSRPIDIGPDGMVSQDGQQIAQVNVVDFKDPSALVKRGSNYFAVDLATISPDTAPQTADHPRSVGSRQFPARRIRRTPGQHHAPVREPAKSHDHRKRHEPARGGGSGQGDFVMFGPQIEKNVRGTDDSSTL